MAKNKNSDLGDLANDLRRLSKNVEKIPKERDLSLAELFNDQYMQSITRFNSFDDFLHAGGFDASIIEEHEENPNPKFDAFISANTDFDNWQDMIDGAVDAYIDRSLFSGTSFFQ